MGSWTASQNLSLAQATPPAPVLMQSWDRTPRIRSVTVYNVSTEAIGVFIERTPSLNPDYVVGPNTLFTMPVGICTTVVFAVFPLGSPPSGSAILTVTEEVLATGVSPLAPNPLGAFILDQSLLDSGNTLS